MRVLAGFLAAVGMRASAVYSDVKLPTWDTKGDGKGVAVRRVRSTSAANTANAASEHLKSEVDELLDRKHRDLLYSTRDETRVTQLKVIKKNLTRKMSDEAADNRDQ